MSDISKAYDCLKDEGYTHLTVNHSLNVVDSGTGGHTQRNENTWWGVKQSMPFTGTSKDLFESYLQQWLWRQHYGDGPFAKTLSSISPTSTHGTELEEGNQWENNTQRHDEGK